MIPMTHELKIYKEYADAIISGEKTFEIRRNDRRYAVGDIIKFIEVLDGMPVQHEITKKVYKISYFLTGWGLMDDWCVFSIVDITDEELPDTQVITRKETVVSED